MAAWSNPLFLYNPAINLDFHIFVMLKLCLTFDHMVGWYACSICECPLISDIATAAAEGASATRAAAFQSICERDS